MQSYDVIIIGAGASGLMCAATAGYRGKSVLVIERSNKIGRKILMSGGGRCNFTNLHNSAANFVSKNPHFCKSALSRYPARSFIELVERHGIDFHEKTLGQLFCDDSSKQIVDLLLTECDWAGVEIKTHTDLTAIEKTAEGFLLKANGGRFSCRSLVIATGGLSIPNGGATDFAYRVAEQFGLEVTPLAAALVPFTLQPQQLEHLKQLAGVSHRIIATANGVSFTEQMLFTHRGLSGPAILQVSNYWAPGDVVELNLFPGMDLLAELKTQRETRPKAEITTVLSQYMSRKMAQVLCELFGFAGQMGDLSNARLTEIAEQFSRWQIKPSGTEGYRTAEVTRGGINTDQISQKTMEAKAVEGLYFIGECLDVTGHLGGHNFQWAWASGVAAGQAV
ncbi:NAD(P)/FAD-dependent oxidoreductase [Neptuniibacter sp. CAU 1671]|uniref:NAD(P)/FAD-dependent oxidoreductase n=1 Tax=Neptuniibacter sp. CAU 1671 TaxID=3032593 RepID=UPI0023DCB7F5|nr:NAD(P)/FAD-dependent oxidoreductase [Neptuniibacter sp. CAU 1671]MDF2180440.1 NAD(P)/FAD-dependent oxidoreductase [Neptuniibacter sp. CAU 1671]